MAELFSELGKFYLGGRNAKRETSHVLPLRNVDGEIINDKNPVFVDVFWLKM